MSDGWKGCGWLLRGSEWASNCLPNTMNETKMDMDVEIESQNELCISSGRTQSSYNCKLVKIDFVAGEKVSNRN